MVFKYKAPVIVPPESFKKIGITITFIGGVCIVGWSGMIDDFVITHV